MLGSLRASVMPLNACGKMKSTSPDFSDANSVSLSVFGTITTCDAIGLCGPQYLSFFTSVTWSGDHESIFHSREENGMLSWKSAETSLQFVTLLASSREGPVNRVLYGAYTVLKVTTTSWSSLPC